jgi:hypothetical protein
LLAKDVEPISVETARKWIRGKSLPHASRLRVLCAWLSMDVTLSDSSIEQFKVRPYGQNSNTTNGSAQELIQILNKLKEDEVKALTEIARLYLKKRKP